MPYRVANEYICSRLGQFIGLPVPPHALMRIGQDENCFAILDFDSEKSSLFPINAQACVDFDSRLCTGIVLFDVLIGNPDKDTCETVVQKRLVSREEANAAERFW